MSDAAKRIVLNTKGTIDKEDHEVSDDIKEILAYMDGNAPESDYSRLLDNAVKEVKQNEGRGLEYMNINANRAEERELAKFSTYVEQIRVDTGTVSDELFMSITHIPLDFLLHTRQVISEHPDWDDEEVADEVLFMQENEKYVDDNL